MSEHKQNLVKQSLELGITQVIVNTTLPGVKLPDHLIGEKAILLNLSWKFGTYLEILDHGIYADLSFNKQTYSCVIPWSCLFAIRNITGNFIVFREGAPIDDLPVELLGEPGHRLTVVSGGGDEPSPPRTGHLKLLN
jgi:stringent starvation protein B